MNRGESIDRYLKKVTNFCHGECMGCPAHPICDWDYETGEGNREECFQTIVNNTNGIVYITGLIDSENAFQAEVSRLENIGFDVIDSCTILNEYENLINQPTEAWYSAVQTCCAAMLGCDRVLFVGQWQDSDQAKIEHKIAELVHMPIHHNIDEITRLVK